MVSSETLSHLNFTVSFDFKLKACVKQVYNKSKFLSVFIITLAKSLKIKSLIVCRWEDKLSFENVYIA